MQVVLPSQQLFYTSPSLCIYVLQGSMLFSCQYTPSLLHAVTLLASYPGSQFLKFWGGGGGGGGGGWKALHGEHCHLIHLILPQVNDYYPLAGGHFSCYSHWKCLYNIFPRLYKPGLLFQKSQTKYERPSQGFYFYIQEHDPPGLLHPYFCNKNSHLTIIVGQLQRCISQELPRLLVYCIHYKANVIKFIVSCLPPAWYFDPASFFLLS